MLLSQNQFYCGFTNYNCAKNISRICKLGTSFDFVTTACQLSFYIWNKTFCFHLFGSFLRAMCSRNDIFLVS